MGRKQHSQRLPATQHAETSSDEMRHVRARERQRWLLPLAGCSRCGLTAIACEPQRRGPKTACSRASHTFGCCCEGHRAPPRGWRRVRAPRPARGAPARGLIRRRCQPPAAASLTDVRACAPSRRPYGARRVRWGARGPAQAQDCGEKLWTRRRAQALFASRKASSSKRRAGRLQDERALQYSMKCTTQQGEQGKQACASLQCSYPVARSPQR